MYVKCMNSKSGHAPGAKNLPLSTLEQGYKELKPDQEYPVICQGGVRSASACEFSKRPRPHRYQCRRWYECLARSNRIRKNRLRNLIGFSFCNPLI